MFIPDPDLCPSRISDPGSKNGNKREWKKFVVPFFCSHKYHKIWNYFIHEEVKKKIRANLQRILELCTQKLSSSSQKYKLGYEIRDPEKTYSGSRIQGSKRRRIRIRNTAFRLKIQTLVDSGTFFIIFLCFGSDIGSKSSTDGNHKLGKNWLSTNRAFKHIFVYFGMELLVCHQPYLSLSLLALPCKAAQLDRGHGLPRDL